MSLRAYIGTSALLVGLIGAAATASGHALMMNKDAKPGAWHLIEIGIPHGCVGSPTNTIKIKVPEGISLVRPQVKAGWKLTMTKRKIDKPIVAEGTTITDMADEVMWSGGSVGDVEFDRFAMLVKLPNDPGKTLYFKTVQVCDKGEHRWIEIPEGGKKWGEYKEPAPFVQISGAP